MNTNILISPQSAAETLGPGVKVLDVRWQLGNPNTYDEYLAGHLPSAVYVDLDKDLASPPTPEDGRHPLPDLGAFQTAARSWGLNDGDVAYIYDQAGNMSAARAWWLLTASGVESYLIDGALPAWIAAGLELETGPTTPEPGNVTLPDALALPMIGIDEAASFADAGGVLLDARAKERYLGLTEPIDPRPGHIPGAVSAATGDNLTTSGRFLPPYALRKRFAALGVRPGRPLAAYCGSGVTACHEIAALTIAGYQGALYPGSWSQWSHTDWPAATEEETP
ncbi:MAG: sulfurtransferase [Propionibacteriaceae bacterium]|jgi:thiosulfate/3-mercaptopyruvate sulfurtransferase|nr:sulfurtransferase [Propionibacteriaceae bacterium]